MSALVLRTALLSIDFTDRDGSGHERIVGSDVPPGAAILSYGFDSVTMALSWVAGTEWQGRFGFEGLNYSTTFDAGLTADAARQYRHAFPSGLRLPVAARPYFEWKNIDLTDALLSVRGRWWINYMAEK